MIKSTFDLEKKLISEGYNSVIGIDEAGRGPLAGPIVACATMVRNFQLPIYNFQSISNDQFPNDKNFIRNINLIRDSKTLSEKQREKLYDFICENFYVGIGMCDRETIDRVNILEATYLAMKKALYDLSRTFPLPALRATLPLRGRGIALVDGNKIIPNLSIEQQAIVNGDKIVKSISAASIVAKVTRDRIMREMHKIYPEYDFAKHKGYGTSAHMMALQKFGPCEIHRRSFAPVRRCRDRSRPVHMKP